MIRIVVNEHYRVSATAAGTLNADFDVVAEGMRDVCRFATHDLFHRRVIPHESDGNGQPETRGRLWIEHAMLGLTVVRQGTLLWQRQDPDANEQGFGFSDLSRRDPRRGFPHACHYRLTRDADDQTLLRLDVHGRWTATWVPRALVAAYLRVVMSMSIAQARRALTQPTPETFPPRQVIPR